MKLEVVSHQVTFVGKFAEQDKIETALKLLANEMGINHPVYFDNSEKDCDEFDLGFAYDQDEFTVSQVKDMWREIKKENM